MSATTSGTNDMPQLSPSHLAEPPPTAARSPLQALVATPFRLAAAGVLGGAAAIAILEWLVFRSTMAVGLLALLVVAAPILVLVERSRGARPETTTHS